MQFHWTKRNVKKDLTAKHLVNENKKKELNDCLVNLKCISNAER